MTASSGHHRSSDYSRYRLAVVLLLLFPVLLLYVLVFLLPLIGILGQSLFDPGFTLEHYQELGERALYLRIIVRTLRVSATVAMICLLVGYPMAYLMARLDGWRAALIGICVLLSMWTSVLVRSFVWSVILARTGPINTVLQGMGLTHMPLKLLFTEGAVVMAMVHIMLPFMILPLYAVLRTIPRELTQAALGLGATPWAILREVVIPLSRNGIVAGTLLVFVTSLGFFITPALVGGAPAMMAASLISREVTEGGNWGFAAALSLTLLVAALGVVAIVRKATGFGAIAEGTP